MPEGTEYNTNISFEGTPDDFLGALIEQLNTGSERRVAQMIREEMANFALYGLRPAIYDIFYPQPERTRRPSSSDDLE